METWSLEPARVTLKAVPREAYEFFGWVDMDTEQEIETEAVLSFAWKGGRRLMARFRPQLVHVDGDSLMAVVSKQTTIGQHAPDDLVYLPAGLQQRQSAPAPGGGGGFGQDVPGRPWLTVSSCMWFPLTAITKSKPICFTAMQKRTVFSRPSATVPGRASRSTSWGRRWTSAEPAQALQKPFPPPGAMAV